MKLKSGESDNWKESLSRENLKSFRQDELKDLGLEELIKVHNTDCVNVGRHCSKLLDDAIKEKVDSYLDSPEFLRSENHASAMKAYQFLKTAYPDIAVSSIPPLINFLVKSGHVKEAVTVYNGRPSGSLSPRRMETVLQLTKSLVDEGSLEMAIDLLRSYRSTEGGTPVSRSVATGTVFQLINKVTDRCSAADCCRLLEALYVYGFIPNNNSALVRAVELYTTRLQFDNAVFVFEDVAARFRRLPYANRLMELLIKKENSELLQRVFDAVSRRRGDSAAITMLALALVSEKRYKQAEHLLMKPGVVIDQEQLARFCRLAVERNRMFELEAILQVISKQETSFDRRQLYAFLLIACRNTADCQTASKVWQAMKEESLTPSEREIILFNKIFMENGQQVPSDLPAPSKRSEDNSATRGTTPRENDFFEGRTKPLERTLQSLLLDSEVIAVIRQGFRPSIPLLRNVLKNFAETDDLLSMRKLEGMLHPTESRPLRISQAILMASINRGEYDEILRTIAMRPTANISSSVFANLLQKNPDLENKVSLYGETAFKFGNPSPKIGLWLYYLIANREADANLILDQVGSDIILDYIRPFYLMDLVRSLKRKDLLEKVLKTVKDVPNSYRVSAFYALLISQEIGERNVDRAKALFDEAKDAGLTVGSLMATVEERLQRISSGDETAFCEKLYPEDELHPDEQGQD
ncbi:unnamed protein product [Soboliphyme baturini]|uniref:PPR_long domain-containing protein n=1 Tax=Soboliphyme baturini TaxID=241478 RepID=A0A183IPK0_9BILA|nr:unnamed protein product [Soboliphyme baturini]